jgi:mono/diheme cytochrome c family protein
MQFRLVPALIILALPSLGADTAQKIDFSRDIQPIFQQRCAMCHGAKTHLSGLRLDDRDSAKRVIQPGKSADSRLIQKVKGSQGSVMPPVGPKLTPAQITLLAKWIDQGATWPASASTAPHWAWQPVTHPASPSVKRMDWSANDIDRFVLAKLEKENLAPSPQADRATLLRRVSLDLTGLPPTPQEVAAFLADTRPDAYAREVDRLLASPHYGEKWARYWLDLAHYADSDGYEKDLVRPWAWRYRDWVINAYNSDMPYDRFVTLQIAGDEVPNATEDDRIATGFYRNTLTNREAGVDRHEARFDQLVDRVGTTGTVFLGITLRCSQCHDHKFDPMRQRDFYRMMAYFNSADESDIDAPLPGETGSYLRAKPEYDRKRAEILAADHVADLQTQWEQDMLAAMKNPGKNLDWDFRVTEIRAGFDHADRILNTPPAQRSLKDSERLTARFLLSPGPRIAADKPLAAEVKDARDKLAELDKSFPALSEAYVMEDRSDNGAQHIAIRGDYKNPGDEVQPGVPGFLPGSDKPAPRRLDLAKWILEPDNPLTARVAVNRIWQELFGRGLVSTSDDFGAQGDKPSHPELLDWLATEYRRLGWSNKALIREIVLSSAYRQSAHIRPELEERDPDNTLLARQSRVRLPAELIRDEALEASGLLDTDIGGPSIKPYQPAGVAELGYGSTKKWLESPGREKYRRGVYVHYQRTTPYPFLVNFDAPDTELSCTRRRVSNTPLQSLDLLNDPVFFEAAQALAFRVLAQPEKTFNDRVNYAYQLVLGRKPTAAEASRLASYLDTQSGILAKEPQAVAQLAPDAAGQPNATERAAWVGASRVLLNLDEFITRE